MIEIKEYNGLPTEELTLRANTLFHDPKWINVIEEVYELEVKVAVNGKTHFVFALIDNLLGKQIISLPFSDYAQINSENLSSILEIIEDLKLKYPSYRLKIKSLLSPSSKLLPDCSRVAVLHKIQLNESSQILNKSFLRGVKKAKKEGVVCRITTEKSALASFYQLYSDLRKQKFKSIPQPFAFFEKIYTNYISISEGRLIEALYDDQVIASILVLEFKNCIYYKFGASDLNHLHLRPNNAIFNELIQYAKAKNYDTIDLGLSGSSDAYKGLRRFKEGMGGTPQALSVFEYIPNSQDISAIDSKKATLGILTSQIVEGNYSTEQIDGFSKLLYPYFA